MTVIVLFGGRSDERHVSVASAQNIVRTLGAPLAWFWAPNGAVYDVNREELLAHPNPLTNDFQPSRPAIWPGLRPGTPRRGRRRRNGRADDGSARHPVHRELNDSTVALPKRSRWNFIPGRAR
jgi:hypothetical protein